MPPEPHAGHRQLSLPLTSGMLTTLQLLERHRGPGVGRAPAAGWDPSLCPWVAVQPEARGTAQGGDYVLFGPCERQLIPASLTPGTARTGPSWAGCLSAGSRRSLGRKWGRRGGREKRKKYGFESQAVLLKNSQDWKAKPFPLESDA